MQQQAAAPDGGEWRIWIERILLFLGTAQIIAGIFFFFAYNWDDLTRWQKLGITQGCVVLAAIGARVAGLDSLIGRLLLLAAGALVGVSFAVYGQIYQTGADAFTLFASWAAVIVGWVLIARFAAFWILWALIVNVALALYLDAVTNLDSVEQSTLLGVLNGGFLMLHEFARRRFVWLAHAWPRHILLAACLVLLALATVEFMNDRAFRRWPALMSVRSDYIALPVFLIVAFLSYLWSRYRAHDLVGLFLVLLATSGVAWYAIHRTLYAALEWREGLFLAMAVITLMISGLAGWWLHSSWLLLEGAKDGDGSRNDAK